MDDMKTRIDNVKAVVVMWQGRNIDPSRPIALTLSL